MKANTKSRCGAQRERINDGSFSQLQGHTGHPSRHHAFSCTATVNCLKLNWLARLTGFNLSTSAPH